MVLTFFEGPLTEVSSGSTMLVATASSRLAADSGTVRVVTWNNTAGRFWRVLDDTFVHHLIPKLETASTCWPCSAYFASLARSRAREFRTPMKHVMMSGQGRRRQDWVSVFTSLVRAGRSDASMCAGCGVISTSDTNSSRNFHHGRIARGRRGFPVLSRDLENGNLPRRHLPINQTRDCFSGEFKKRPWNAFERCALHWGSHPQSITTAKHLLQTLR